MHNHRQLLIDRFQCRTAFKMPQTIDTDCTLPCRMLRTLMQRYPHLCPYGKHVPLRHHPYDPVACTIDPHGLTNHTPGTRKPVLPQIIANHHNRLSTIPIVRLREFTAQNRPRPGQAKNIWLRHNAKVTPGSIPTGYIQINIVIRTKLRYPFKMTPDLGIIMQVNQPVAPRPVLRCTDHHQRFAVLKRQRFQDHHIQKGK